KALMAHRQRRYRCLHDGHGARRAAVEVRHGGTAGGRRAGDQQPGRGTEHGCAEREPHQGDGGQTHLHLLQNRTAPMILRITTIPNTQSTTAAAMPMRPIGWEKSFWM